MRREMWGDSPYQSCKALFTWQLGRIRECLFKRIQHCHDHMVYILEEQGKQSVRLKTHLLMLNLALWPWTSQVTMLNFIFLICRVEKIIALSQRVVGRMKQDKANQGLNPMPGTLQDSGNDGELPWMLESEEFLHTPALPSSRCHLGHVRWCNCISLRRSS